MTQPDIKISVVGVGGGGSAIVSRIATLLNQGSRSLISLTVINTDAQALNDCENVKKLLIGKSLNRGLGSGMDPDKGRAAAEIDKSGLCEIFKNADMTFLVGCLGGGTGSGALPVVADLAAKAGSLVVGVVTKPFSFEGDQRAKIAEEAISKMEYKVNSIITFSNDRIVDLAKGKVKFTSALSLVDKVVAEGIKSIADLILTPGIVNIDFSDIKTILGNTGHALIGVGEASGPHRAVQAARNVLSSPLLTFPIDGATGILFNVAGGESLSLMEIKEAAEVITESVDEDVKTIFGATQDNSLGNKIKITLIAVGLGRTKGASYRAPEDIKFRDNLMIPESKLPNVKMESKNLSEDNEDDDIIEKFFEGNQLRYSKGDKRLDIPAFIRRKMREL